MKGLIVNKSLGFKPFANYLCNVKISIILLAFFLFLKPIIPVVDYVMNYEYISKVLCVNKEIPKMHCNGKCHLMKELAKASENEKPISSDKKSSVQEHEVLFFQSISTLEIVTISLENNLQINNHYSNLYTFSDCTKFFHPPSFIS